MERSVEGNERSLQVLKHVKPETSCSGIASGGRERLRQAKERELERT